MPKRFEYQVCYSVLDRVTFVNGVWQGDDIPESDRKQQDAEGCLLVWDYLAKAGEEGWELVSVLETIPPVSGQPYVRTMYFKRET